MIFKLVIVLGKGFSFFLDAKIWSFSYDLKFEGQLYIFMYFEIPNLYRRIINIISMRFYLENI